jgi:hypothetical protein
MTQGNAPARVRRRFREEGLYVVKEIVDTPRTIPVARRP